MIKCPVCKNTYIFSHKSLQCPSCKFSPLNNDGIIEFISSETTDEYFFPVEGFQNLYKHEENHFWFKARNQVISNILQQCMTPDSNLCEVGCGTGIISKHLKSQGYHMTCCELYKEGLVYAKLRNSGEEYYACNLYSFPFISEYDGIIACDVLEHLEDDTSALENIYNSLKPGGYCLITVPALNNLWSDMDIYAGHKRRYSRHTLEKKVNDANFIIHRLSYFMMIPGLFLFIKRTGLEKLIPSQFSNGRDEPMKRSKMSFNELALPPVVNKVFIILLKPEMRIFEYCNLPFGSSLICLAQKPFNA